MSYSLNSISCLKVAQVNKVRDGSEVYSSRQDVVGKRPMAHIQFRTGIAEAFHALYDTGASASRGACNRHF